ncbi:MAG: hypothetical protein WA801_08435, partial [Pseudolabrys sp.]
SPTRKTARKMAELNNSEWPARSPCLSKKRWGFSHHTVGGLDQAPPLHDQGPAGDGSGDDLPRAREVSSEKLATCHCQRRNLPHVIIGKAPAWLQHCADTFQKNRTALDRHSVRSGHHNFQLRIAQANHAPIMPQQ